jgi:hypothetical protein
LLYQGVGVLALQKIRALVPITVICNIRALLQEVEIEMRRSPEVLLSMSIIALAPFVLFIDVWTKTSFV